MPTEKMRAKNAKGRAKMAARYAGRQCAVKDCIKPSSPTTARYCTTHRGRYHLTGNPLGIRPRREHYGDYLTHIERLWRLNADHPATPAAIQTMRGWLENVVEAQDISGKYRKRTIGETIGIRAIQQGVTPHTLLLEATAAFCWAMETRSCMEVKNELALSITDAMMSTMEIRKAEGGVGLKITERREIARFLSEHLFGFFSMVAQGVQKMLEADLRRATDMRTPF